MPEPNQNPPATVPEQPEAKPPLRKSMPVVIALVVIIGAHRHRQSFEPAERQQKDRAGQRAADASGSAERPAGDELRDAAAVTGKTRRGGAATSAGIGRSHAAA